jgi:hypothetical protein
MMNPAGVFGFCATPRERASMWMPSSSRSGSPGPIQKEIAEIRINDINHGDFGNAS